jgi:glycosyltransferase involved in cell wall biosynthesis
MLELSVVIPTYNRLETLERVIPALLASDLDPERYEIIVADSNSSDGTAEFLARQARKRPSLRHLPGAYSGRAMARNAGIDASRGEVVLFTDSDILASPDLLSRHLERHRTRVPIAVVGTEIQVKSFEEYELLREHPEMRRPLHPPHRKRLSWLYFMTGNASVKRADLMRVGRFDESFTGYGHEDLELGYRLQSYGVQIVYEPRAVNYHWQYIPYEEQKEKMKLAGRSTVRFYRKHPDLRVQARLGMTPVSLFVHGMLGRAPALMESLERAAGERDGIARSLVYQYHYVDGIKEALHAERG